MRRKPKPRLQFIIKLIVTRPIAISRVLRAISDRRTDGRMDERTDGPTDRVPYRVACTRLKAFATKYDRQMEVCCVNDLYQGGSETPYKLTGHKTQRLIICTIFIIRNHADVLAEKRLYLR